jgi:hypothetical protein
MPWRRRFDTKVASLPSATYFSTTVSMSSGIGLLKSLSAFLGAAIRKGGLVRPLGRLSGQLRLGGAATDQHRVRIEVDLDSWPGLKPTSDLKRFTSAGSPLGNTRTVVYNLSLVRVVPAGRWPRAGSSLQRRWLFPSIHPADWSSRTESLLYRQQPKPNPSSGKPTSRLPRRKCDWYSLLTKSFPFSLPIQTQPFA